MPKMEESDQVVGNGDWALLIILNVWKWNRWALSGWFFLHLSRSKENSQLK